MAVFLIVVRGHDLRATFDGEEIACGFFKNEYVWAGSPEQASAKALASVETALPRQTVVNMDGLTNFRLTVERIEGNRGLSDLLNSEGFIFHRLDGEDESTDD